MKIYFKILFVSSLIIFLNGMVDHELNDYFKHPCIRNCSASNKPMKCYYDWTIETFATMSKACFDCPFNITDCFRPQCISANGIKRQVIAINKEMPGPAIQVCQNDQVIVNIFNGLHMAESTSIHWHGILQKETPFMDGVGMITQCPIEAHSSFQYRFNANDAGTHMWHSHSGLQRADGLFGAFIVRQKREEEKISSFYDFDLTEHVIVMNDWFDYPIALSFALHVHYDRSRFNWADSILINGRGSSKKTNYTLDSKNYLTPKASFRVKSGYRYRFRLIHAGISHCAFQISIEDHDFKVIATDGHYVEPFDVQTLVIYAGERFDIVVNANRNKSASYLIKVKGLGNCQNAKAFETAYLVYDDNKIVNKEIAYESLDVSGREFNNYEESVEENTKKHQEFMRFKGMSNEKEDPQNRLKQKEVDKKFYIRMSFELLNNPEFNSELFYPVQYVKPVNRYFMPQLNYISMAMPSSPLLYQINKTPENMFCNESNIDAICPFYKNKLCSCIHTIYVDLNDSVEFVIVHEKDENAAKNIPTLHTMHLHGHSFSIVAVEQFNNASRLYLEDVKALDDAGKINRSLENPIIKDTLVIPRFGYSIIRFIANNPGIWLFHCHFDFHSETGMTLALKVGGEDQLPQSPRNWPQCGSFVFDEHNEGLESLIQINTSSRIATNLDFLLFTIFCIFYLNYNL